MNAQGGQNPSCLIPARAAPFSPRPVAASRNWKALDASDRSWREWCGWKLLSNTTPERCFCQIPPSNNEFEDTWVCLRISGIEMYYMVLDDTSWYPNIFEGMWRYWQGIENMYWPISWYLTVLHDIRTSLREREGIDRELKIFIGLFHVCWRLVFDKSLVFICFL